MAKIKHTKTELKAQSDALKRFQRFLPMLQLKKQQLQAEIAAITARIDEVSARETSPASGLAPLVEAVTMVPEPDQQLVLAIGTSAQPARPEHPSPISKVM